MSKAKHIHNILRGQHQLLQQLQSSAAVAAVAGGASASTKGMGALRLIPTRLVIDPHTQSSIDPSKAPASNSINASAGWTGTGNNKQETTSHSFFDQPFQNTRHNYVFAHGASGFAKHPSKAATLTQEEDRAYFSVQVGEDSYFRRHDALGVADGVGGWSGTTGKFLQFCANPALYSRKLMHYAFLELEKYDNIEEEAFYDYFNVNPVQILQKSYDQSARDAKQEGLIGSSTACLAILRDDELRIANLGDCGVSIIRKNEFIFRTEEQQHSFNYPYQLGTGSTDSPTDAQVFTVKVQSGDIVVMGTDGIFDNLFDEDILEEVVRCVNGGVDPSLNYSPYGTGKSSPSSSSSSSGKQGGVGGLWSGLTSSAAKLASTAIAGKSAAGAESASATIQPSTSLSSSKDVNEGSVESLAALFNNPDEDSESCSELSPIAAAAIAAAASSSLPPSASLYPTTPFSTAATRSHNSPSASASAAAYLRKVPEPSVISDALAKRAKNVSEDTRHHGSPFQSRAMQEGLYYQGGKQDDMSVLVAIIKVAEDSPDRR
ncbi:hypothetical protein BGX28_004907 [Mortierella sp. GBA30]|nr:hypothetical protein BGX28_004907 [Mortierella sp. GBA30]